MNRGFMMSAVALACSLGMSQSQAAQTESLDQLQRLIDRLDNAPVVAQAEATPEDAAAAPAPEAPATPPAEAPAVAPEAPAPETPPAVEPPAAPEAPAPEAAAPETPPATPQPEAPALQDLLGAPAPEAPAAPAPAVEPPAAPETPAPEAAAPKAKVAKDDTATGKTLDDAQVVRLKAQEIEGIKKYQEAKKMLDSRRPDQMEKAIPLFEQALGNIPERPATEKVRADALFSLGDAGYRLAEYNYGRIGYTRDEIADSIRFASDAEKFIAIALKDEKGHGKSGRDLLRKIQAASTKLQELAARPIPPKYREEFVQRVKTNEALIDEGRKFYQLEDFDKAEANFNEVLRKDPYNKDVMKFLRRIEERRLAISNIHRETTRADMLQDVRESWNPPLRTTADSATLRPQAKPTGTPTSSRALLEKMQSIVIPSIEFRQANIVDVINFLRDASEEQDPSPNKAGVNIILKTDVAGAPAYVPTSPTETTGLEGGSVPPGVTPPAGSSPFGETPAPVTAEAAPAGMSTAPITLTLRRVTLLEAVRLVTDVANLKYRVEDNAVIITPKGSVEGVVTRLYPVQPSILEITSARPRDEAAGGGENRTDFITMGGGNTGTIDRNTNMRQFFEGNGVPFPPGTSIAYNQAISQLIVRNTPENLEILERIIQQIDVIPKQVEIEARFVEVAENQLSELGFEWLLTDPYEVAVKKGSGPIEGRQRLVVNGNSATGGFTKGMRYFNQQASSDSPSAIARSTDTAATFLGDMFSISGILTNPELSLVIHAMEQKGDVDVLSSPRVTTKSGVNAFIKVVEEIIYPTEYTQQDQGQIIANGNQNDPTQPAVPSRPPIPGSFQTREVGVILNVTPIVGADGQTVDLTMVPEVAELVRWIDYGPGGLYPILQPVFASRNVTTSVSIWDGQTIAMGGLIREQQQNMDDKIPVLGDIPLLGNLFKSKGSYSRKQNLIIFVTAKIVDPAGNAIRRGGAAVGMGTTTTPAGESTPK